MTEPLEHAAGNQFNSVVEDDTVWFVTVRGGDLHLVGKLEVETVCNQEEAADYPGCDPEDLLEATHYIIAKDGGLVTVYLDIHPLAPLLRFNNPNGKTCLELKDGKISPKQLKAMRELALESAQCLEEAYQAECTESETEDETGERCPFCKEWNNWGEMNTCQHHIGVVFDGGMVESDIGQELESVWSSLADKIDVMEEMGESALIEKSQADAEIVRLVLKKCSPNLVGFPELESVFNIQQGDLTVQDEGMLGSSVYSLFVEDPDDLEGKVRQLKLVDESVPN